jgi:hypothetical protein
VSDKERYQGTYGRWQVATDRMSRADEEGRRVRPPMGNQKSGRLNLGDGSVFAPRAPRPNHVARRAHRVAALVQAMHAAAHVVRGDLAGFANGPDGPDRLSSAFARLCHVSAFRTRSPTTVDASRSRFGSKWCWGACVKNDVRSPARSWLMFNPTCGTGGYRREPFTTQKGWRKL